MREANASATVTLESGRTIEVEGYVIAGSSVQWWDTPALDDGEYTHADVYDRILPALRTDYCARYIGE